MTDEREHSASRVIAPQGKNSSDKNSYVTQAPSQECRQHDSSGSEISRAKQLIVMKL